MALGAGSAAIDAALSAICPAADQRGIVRPFGAGCDIGAYESDVLDESPPVLTVPTGIVTNATGPDGAAASYSASAVDEVDGPVAVTCVPPTGATFAIGTTAVTCVASDTAGNVTSASFDVHVKGADEQLDDLAAAVNGVGLVRASSTCSPEHARTGRGQRRRWQRSRFGVCSADGNLVAVTGRPSSR